MKYLLLFLLVPCIGSAQFNCMVFPEGSPCRQGCEKYLKALEHFQGSKQEQYYLDSAIEDCPGFAEGYREKSVAYLKSGQFGKWKRLIDKAVQLDSQSLRVRGWCLFKFLKDYEGAIRDLEKLAQINKGFPGQSGDGDYDLWIVIALCYRELGDLNTSLQIFNKTIREHEDKNNLGIFDYLHRGVLKMRMKDFQGASEDFQKQIVFKENVADFHYHLGLANMALGNLTIAHLNFKEAKELFDKELHRGDPYCEELDIVYYQDILEAIKETE